SRHSGLQRRRRDRGGRSDGSEADALSGNAGDLPLHRRGAGRHATSVMPAVPGVEVALLVARAEHLARLDELKRATFDQLSQAPTRLYFGNEFCRYLIPSPPEVQKARATAETAGMAFTLLTPYVPDAGVDALL